MQHVFQAVFLLSDFLKNCIMNVASGHWIQMDRLNHSLADGQQSRIFSVWLKQHFHPPLYNVLYHFIKTSVLGLYILFTKCKVSEFDIYYSLPFFLSLPWSHITFYCWSICSLAVRTYSYFCLRLAHTCSTCVHTLISSLIILTYIFYLSISISPSISNQTALGQHLFA